MNGEWCIAISGGIRLALHIMPNAKKSEVIGLLDRALKIRLHAQPVDGKANDALIRYLADLLDVPKSAILITQGHTGKRKTVEIRPCRLTIDAVRQVLAPDAYT